MLKLSFASTQANTDNPTSQIFNLMAHIDHRHSSPVTTITSHPKMMLDTANSFLLQQLTQPLPPALLPPQTVRLVAAVGIRRTMIQCMTTPKTGLCWCLCHQVSLSINCMNLYVISLTTFHPLGFFRQTTIQHGTYSIQHV